MVAGAISGAVGGTVIRQNGSTGGTDIVAAWVRKKYPEASFVWVIFCLNASVAALSFFVYGYRFEPVILCLIYCYLTSSISDRILKGGKTALKFEIVTQDPQAHSRAAPLRHAAVGAGDVFPHPPLHADLRGEPAPDRPFSGDFSGVPQYICLCLHGQ